MKNVGEGGTSAVLGEDIVHQVYPGSNEGSGKVIIRACKLTCPKDAVCRFSEGNIGLRPTERCICNNGNEPRENSCEETKESTSRILVASHIFILEPSKGTIDIHTNMRFILALVVALFLLLLISCNARLLLLHDFLGIAALCCCLYRRKRQNAFDWPKEMQLMVGAVATGPGDRSSRSSSVYNGNRIAGNPLYEDWYFQSTTMPHISRHFIKVLK